MAGAPLVGADGHPAPERLDDLGIAGTPVRGGSFPPAVPTPAARATPAAGHRVPPGPRRPLHHPTKGPPVLDDREQRLLDATEVLLGRDDPELAASLREHRLPPRRTRRSRAPGTGSGRLPRPGRAFWPPTIMFLICLLLVVVPALVLELRTAPPPAGVVDAPAPAPVPR